MLIVAGLGNPGPRYAGNRHNAGFLVVDELARRYQSVFLNRFNAHISRTIISNRDVILIKPMTFMNRSGKPIQEVTCFYKIEPSSSLIVIHDELDIPFGSVRLKNGGGLAGHKGLKSIASNLGTNDFSRVRAGIGRPEGKMSVTDYVLGDFSAEERIFQEEFIGHAADAVVSIIEEGIESSMNHFNKKVGPEEPLQ